jgi:excisionase family DNA binding protein
MPDPTPGATAGVERLAYSPSEAAAALGCTRQHVQNMIRRGELRSVTLGRKRLIPRQALAELLGNTPAANAS